MFAADAVKLAPLWGLHRVSWLRGRCFRVGEWLDGRETVLACTAGRCRRSDSGGPESRFGARIGVRNARRGSASGDTIAWPGAEHIQDVSKYVPSCYCSCQASSLSTSIMGPPQRGQIQVVGSRFWLGAAGTEDVASVASSCRHSGNNSPRLRGARKPKKRMRTKRGGSTCCKNRRKNSSAVSVINRRLLP